MQEVRIPRPHNELCMESSCDGARALLSKAQPLFPRASVPGQAAHELCHLGLCALSIKPPTQSRCPSKQPAQAGISPQDRRVHADRLAGAADLCLDDAVVLEQGEGEASPHVKLDLLKDHRLPLLQQPLGLPNQCLRKAPPVRTCTPPESAKSMAWWRSMLCQWQEPQA